MLAFRKLKILKPFCKLRSFSNNNNLGMESVTNFWFNLTQQQHFKKDQELDKLIEEKFGHMVEAAKLGEYDMEANTPDGALGLIVLLYQFTRNIYRDSPDAFSGDMKAIEIAKQTIDAGLDKDMPTNRKSFVYLPFMHSEILAEQERGVALNAAAGNNTEWNESHMRAIEKFGRFPHRNKILGRESTPEELEFLTQPNSSW